MLKAKATSADGHTILILGLTSRNLEDMRSRPGDSYLSINGKELGLPVDITIFYGETEAHCAEVLNDMIGPDTKVNVDPKLRS